jgi:hypothetical protein
MARTEYTSGTLPAPPEERPARFTEDDHGALEDAYWNAYGNLKKAEEAEREARQWRATANRSVRNYERLLEEARGQLTIDDIQEET